MRQKNQIFLFVIALLIVLQIAAVNASISDEPNIKATLLNQEPDPVQPGRYVDLRFRVENLGTASVDNLVFEILPEYPLSLNPGDSPRLRLGTFNGRSTGNTSATLYYKLRVDPGAIEGPNKIRLSYSKDDGSSWTILDDFYVRIQSVDSQISITSVTTIPDRLEPGKISRLVLRLTNFADTFVQDASIKLDLSSASMPFSPVNSTTERKIRTLAAGSSADFSFDLITLGNAESSIYKVPIQLKYYDTTGALHNKSDYISLIVGVSPDIMVMIDSQAFYTSGVAGDISIKFVNKGVTNAKFMNVKLEQTDKFELLSSDDVYIGKLDSDDFETADFKLYVKPTKDKTISLPLIIDYADANNKAYHQELDLPLRLYSGSELKKFGLVKGNSLFGIVLLVVIAGVGYYIYRRKKKAKK